MTVIAADDAALTPLLEELRDRGGQVIHLSKVEPTLEDAFLKIVGRGLGENAVLEELERNLRAVRARAYVRVVATFRELSWVALKWRCLC